MSFKAAFQFENNIYQIEFTLKAEGRRIVYTIVIGSELSAERRTIQIIPTDIPGSKKILWVLNQIELAGRAMNKDFIQAVGEAIERNEE